MSSDSVIPTFRKEKTLAQVFENHRDELDARLGTSREVMQIVFRKAEQAPKRVVLAEGENDKMILAARQLDDEIGEQTNVATQHPGIVSRMSAELENWQQSVLKSYRGEDYPEPPASPPLGKLQDFN